MGCPEEERSRREEVVAWWRQAVRDRRSADRIMETADYAHAAFLAEQAAQKSLKALLRVGHRNARTHELPELLQNIVRVLKLERSADLEAAAASLREHYTGARYPGVRSRMAPSDFYTKEMAQEALECCDKIMEFVRAQLAPTFPDIEQA